MKAWVDLAPGIRAAEMLDADDVVMGWTVEHQRADGAWCAGFVSRQRRESSRGVRGWDTSTGSLAEGTLTTSSSLHSQSIKCHTHPDELHGYIRNGKWVPA